MIALICPQVKTSYYNVINTKILCAFTDFAELTCAVCVIKLPIEYS